MRGGGGRNGAPKAARIIPLAKCAKCAKTLEVLRPHLGDLGVLGENMVLDTGVSCTGGGGGCRMDCL